MNDSSRKQSMRSVTRARRGTEFRCPRRSARLNSASCHPDSQLCSLLAAARTLSLSLSLSLAFRILTPSIGSLQRVLCASFFFFPSAPPCPFATNTFGYLSPATSVTSYNHCPQKSRENCCRTAGRRLGPRSDRSLACLIDGRTNGRMAHTHTSQSVSQTDGHTDNQRDKVVGSWPIDSGANRLKTNRVRRPRPPRRAVVCGAALTKKFAL